MIATRLPAATGLAFLLGATVTFAAARKPNVLLIYTDDQGSVDVNVYGAKDLVTPRMDGLARRGTRFTQFYTAAPVCSPSRASLLTGRYPQRAGLAGNAGSRPGSPGMPTEQVTIAEMMKAAGYRTGHVGKWHLGYVPETMPNRQGFDASFGHMGGCIDNYSHFFYWSGPNRHDLWRDGREVWHDGEFFGELMTRECHRFIETHRDRPFFLYWAINMPHYPLQGTAKWRERYAQLPEPRNKYAAFVSTTDEMIGRVVAKLDALGLREETIIIFQSDHGHSQESRTFGGGGSAGPYRGAKFSLFEGGIRIPAIISGPGRIPENQVRDQMAVNVDWMPTLAELCDVDLPEHEIDGKSLMPIIRSPDAPTRHETFHWQSGRGLGDQPHWAVRQGDWKLIGNPKDTSNKGKFTQADKLFLVNLAEDVGEMKNAARAHPDVTERLKRLYDEWIKTVQAG